MRICVISTASLPTPNFAYSGIERMAALAVRGLSELGHTVHLIAKEGSMQPPNGELVAVGDEKEIPQAFNGLLSRHEIDIVIDESHNKYLTDSHPDFPQLTRYEVMSKMGNPKNPVLISKGQRDTKFGGVDWPILYQHIPLEEYPLYTVKREPYFFFMGQIIEEKRVHWSIAVALETNSPIRVTGPWWGDPKYSDMLREMAKGHPEVDLASDVGGQEKLDIISHARAMLHFPGAKDFCEAGSIVTLECLATGTPVIVSDCGCHREYVTNGFNGFIVGSPEEAIEIIKSGEIDKIDPINCRKSVEWANYTSMATEYDRLIDRVLSGERWAK